VKQGLKVKLVLKEKQVQQDLKVRLVLLVLKEKPVQQDLKVRLVLPA
jgi:hypothetical protein